MRAPFRERSGPWLWSPGVDLGVFGGSAVLALGLVAGRHLTGWTLEPFPEWAWLSFVVAIDVAHVYATLFRTYLDPDEVRRHPLRYVLVPLVGYACGVALYAEGALVFWRVLAYLALFHFIRQQVGWVKLYRARKRVASWEAVLDDATVYWATLYPVIYWHAHLSESRFAWFLEGDFASVEPLARALLPAAKAFWLLCLFAFAVRQVQLGRREGRVELGKSVVVLSTAACWWVGIVATNSDFDFTVTNVLIHGVPYAGLLWAYARARAHEAPEAPGARVVRRGFGAFVAVLLLLALLEEVLWDRFVWHERPWLFGGGKDTFPPAVTTWIVPLLAVPQLTHYLLDGLLWRRRDARERPAQRRAIGLSLS